MAKLEYYVKDRKVGCSAEYDKARTILVHEPRIEMLLGNTCPLGSLYQGPLNREMAVKEHGLYVEEMRKMGIEVIEVGKILLDAIVKEQSFYLPAEFYPDRDLRSHNHPRTLRDLLIDRTRVTYVKIPGERIARSESDRAYAAYAASPEEVLHGLISHHELTISGSPHNTGMSFNIRQNPLYNLMFMRDPMITTDKGVILGKMNSQQRSLEVDLAYFVLRLLGIAPLHRVSTKQGTLEGGDFIPAGDHAFIGIGTRTNLKGAQSVMKGKYMGYDRVYLVEGPQNNQDIMHLDTYFYLANKKHVVIRDDLLDVPVQQFNRKKGKYTKNKSTTLQKILRDRNYNIHTISPEVQALYGPNALLIDNNQMIGVNIKKKKKIRALFKEIEERFQNDPSKEHIIPLNAAYMKMTPRMIRKFHNEYKQVLLASGFDNFGINLLSFNHLNQAWGGPHCLTQVIFRGD